MIADRVVPLVVGKILLLERYVRVPKVPLGFTPLPSFVVSNKENTRVTCNTLFVAVVEVIVISVRVASEILTCDEISLAPRPIDFLKLPLARENLLTLVFGVRFESKAKVLSITQHRGSVRSAIVRDVASESLESLRDKRVMAKLVAEAKESALV